MAAPPIHTAFFLCKRKESLSVSISRDNTHCVSLAVCRLLPPGAATVQRHRCRSSFLGAGTAVVPAVVTCARWTSLLVRFPPSTATRRDSLTRPGTRNNHGRKTQAEQDTFSANGKTLVSQVYHVTFQGFFNNVDFKLVGDGVFIRVPLLWVVCSSERDESIRSAMAVSCCRPITAALKNINHFCAAVSP